MKSLTVLALLAACHHYSVWKYPYPQPKCVTRLAQREEPPPPPVRPEPPPEIDIPLPSLEGMEFPPDCAADWCERLKGVGMLRDRLQTN